MTEAKVIDILPHLLGERNENVECGSIPDCRVRSNAAVTLDEIAVVPFHHFGWGELNCPAFILAGLRALLSLDIDDSRVTVSDSDAIFGVVFHVSYIQL